MSKVTDEIVIVNDNVRLPTSYTHKNEDIWTWSRV